LDPGAHVLDASAKGRKSYSVRFSVREEQALNVEIPRLEPVAAIEPDREIGRQRSREQLSTKTADRSKPPSLRPWAFLSLGVGAAGLSTGAIAGIAALQKQSKLDDTCVDSAHCPREQQGNIEAMSRYAEISTVAFAIGVGAAAAGALLLIIGSDESSAPAKDKASGGAFSVRASIGARGAVISGRF